MAEELACDLVETKKARIEQIKAYDEKMINLFRLRLFKDELANVPLYYCRGAWDEGKMTLLDRKLCGMLKKMVTKKDPATYEPWEAALMEASGPCDWTDKAALNPIMRRYGREKKKRDEDRPVFKLALRLKLDLYL